MGTYCDIDAFAEDLEQRWFLDSQPCINIEQAQELVTRLKRISETDLDELPAIRMLLDYATRTDSWEFDEVADWPQMVMDDLRATPRQYICEPEGEYWQVVGYSLAGEGEWVATVETQRVAEIILASLNTESKTGDGVEAPEEQVYQVWVTRTAYSHEKVVQVRARSKEQAANEAVESAAELDFRTASANYHARDVMTLDDDLAIESSRLDQNLT